MEELDLKELIDFYLKKISIVILSMLLAGLLGYCYIEYYQVPLYEGKTTIILIQKSNQSVSDISDTENQLNVSERLVSTYSQVIKSRRVLGIVKEDLKLEESIDSLSDSIEVGSVSETPIIEITVINENPKQAVVIANEVALVFKEEIIKLYNLENVSVIDEAIINEEPCNINFWKQMIIYIVFGFGISVVVIFCMYYFDNSIKSKKEIEMKFDVPVLGEIPIVKKELKDKKVSKVKRKRSVKKSFSKRGVNKKNKKLGFGNRFSFFTLFKKKDTKEETISKKRSTSVKKNNISKEKLSSKGKITKKADNSLKNNASVVDKEKVVKKGSKKRNSSNSDKSKEVKPVRKKKKEE